MCRYTHHVHTFFIFLKQFDPVRLVEGNFTELNFNLIHVFSTFQVAAFPSPVHFEMYFGPFSVHTCTIHKNMYFVCYLNMFVDICCRFLSHGSIILLDNIKKKYQFTANIFWFLWVLFLFCFILFLFVFVCLFVCLLFCLVYATVLSYIFDCTKKAGGLNFSK